MQSGEDMERFIQDSKFSYLIEAPAPCIPINHQLEESFSWSNISDAIKLLPGSHIVSNGFALLFISCEANARDEASHVHA